MSAYAGTMGRLGMGFRPDPAVADRFRQRMAVDRAGQRGLDPRTGRAVPNHVLMATAVDGGSPLGIDSNLTPNPMAGGQPPQLRETAFDRFGNFLGSKPQAAVVPALFMVEFHFAMPSVNLGWQKILSRLYDFDTTDPVWHEATQYLWSLPIAGTLPFVLFGARALPKAQYEEFRRKYLEPLEARFKARDAHRSKRSKSGRPQSYRGELMCAFLDGGFAYGINPYFKKYYPGWTGYSLSMIAEMTKSATLYAATGLVLDLPLDSFLPAAVGLSFFSNIGGAYMAGVWGSLGVNAGRILAAYVCLFFSAHAISAMESVVQKIPDLPDGLGYLGQAIVASIVSALMIAKVRRDAAQLPAVATEAA